MIHELARRPGEFSQVAAQIRAKRNAALGLDRDDEAASQGAGRRRPLSFLHDSQHEALVGGNPSFVHGDQSDAHGDAQSFAAQVIRAGMRRRGELPVGPSEPSDPVARAILAAGRRRRAEEA